MNPVPTGRPAPGPAYRPASRGPDGSGPARRGPASAGPASGGPAFRDLPPRLRSYLLLLVIVLATPFVLLSALVIVRSTSTQAESMGRDVVAVARALSLAIDARIAPLQSALEVLAQSPHLASGDLVALRAELGDAGQLLGTTLMLSDADGHQMLNTGVPGHVALPRRTPVAYIASTVAAGRPAVSDVHRAAQDGRLLATVDMPVALSGPASGGKATHVLAATVELSTIQDLVTQQRLPPGWSGRVVDRQGRYVQRTPDQGGPDQGVAKLGQPAGARWLDAVRSAPEGWVLTTSRGGVTRCTSYTTSALTGWTVGLSVPHDVVWAPLQGLMTPMLALGVGLTAFSLACALLLARRIVRSIGALAAIARATGATASAMAGSSGAGSFGAGSPGVSPGPAAGGIREVNEVARVLTESIATRQAAEATLRQSGADLRESEAELRFAMELSPQSPWTADANGALLTVNERISALTGTGVEQRVGQGWLEVVHPDDRAAVQAAWAECVGTGRPYDHEFRLRLADGGWRWTRARANPRRDAAGRVVRWYGTTEDVDDRKQAQAALLRLTGSLEARVAEEVTAREAAQARLHQAQRMEALGQLASGVAHDFNNVLQAVQGGLALIGRRPDDAPGVARIASMAADATARGAAITRRLLSLTRRGTLSPGPIDAAGLLAEMAEVLASTLGGGIDVRVATAHGLPPLLADRGQLETVLINLATNARDAMPRGGVLVLSAMADRDPAGLEPGGYIVLAAADTGEGMDAATLARVSEPFFTTKEVGRGTGLGLAMARDFAEESGGALRLTSAPGVGTTVRMWLPLAGVEMGAGDREADARGEAEGRPGGELPGEAQGGTRAVLPRGAGARLLLVDDDAAVRATMAEHLEELGYRVLAASDALSGLRLLRAHEDVAMLVSDLAMPGMDGVALIHAAQRVRPGLPAILVTGYGAGAKAVVDGQAACGPFSLMQKPVSAVQVATRIATLLE